MSEKEFIENGPVDPDPFIIAGLVISAVAALGTLAQGVAALSANRPIPSVAPPSALLEDVLRRSLSDAIRDTEDLIRLLARQNMPTGIDQPVLAGEFRFGNPMLLEMRDFIQFQDVFSRISSSAKMVNEDVLTLLRTRPARAQELGMMMNMEGLNPTQKINEYYRGVLSIGQVLDSALESLKAYQRLLDRLNFRN
ncbi:hypothetical protein G6L74_05775 [Agrobacterium tumefaciens]|uniref:hypothetical protein n=1 Tax=Agrobacterium tumefaciens TaxID=358 RepID=UPI0015723A9C|nr:hypothetical protein [Agrobacterium tumefaciens]